MSEIFQAMEAGDVERVRALALADPGATVAKGTDGLSPVMWARYRDRFDLLDALLSVEPELDVFEAAAVGRAERLVEVLEADPALIGSWSPDGFTPLHLAVFFGHDAAARVLLERGADLSAVSRNGMAVRPLHSAAAGRHRGVVEALLDAGADVDSASHGRFTALHDAAQNGDRAIVELLVARGATVAARDDRGRTARDLALDKGHAEVAELLDESA